MDTVTLDEEEGEDTYGDKNHDAELVTGTHKNLKQSEIYAKHP